MLVAQVRSSVPFSQQCQRGVGGVVWSVISVHIPEETVKITKAIFSCTFANEISLEKIGPSSVGEIQHAELSSPYNRYLF